MRAPVDDTDTTFAVEVSAPSMPPARRAPGPKAATAGSCTADVSDVSAVSEYARFDDVARVDDGPVDAAVVDRGAPDAEGRRLGEPEFTSQTMLVMVTAKAKNTPSRRRRKTADDGGPTRLNSPEVGRAVDERDVLEALMFHRTSHDREAARRRLRSPLGRR